MPTKRTRRAEPAYYSRLAADRFTKSPEIFKLFFQSRVSITVLAPATLREQVIRIVHGATNPFAVESLANELDTIKSVRGSSYFGSLGDVLDGIAQNFPNMRWWISEKGLNMAIVPLEELLGQFDLLAGKLCCDHWKNGRISKTDLRLIARELDARAAEIEGAFLERFEPSARKKIAEYNQKHPRATIKTFEQVIDKPTLVRLVRKRLYRAHERFLRSKALCSVRDWLRTDFYA